MEAKSLQEKLEQKERERSFRSGPQHWRPAEGEILRGVVAKMGSTITEFGDAEYVELQDDAGKTYLVFLNSVLRDLVKAEAVIEGDWIAIKFLGYVQSRKGKRTYRDFVLVKLDGKGN